ncbi:MAG TPA: IS21 family transposase [Desulfobulbus sp.]|nr:IS21 family transposase [Desulfobulbus sp.]HHD64652.1 IS21 family transposase [Desulfobulbaceae bacterium]
MINYEQYCRIRQLKEEGLKAAQISEQMGLDSRTVSKWMDRTTFQQRLPCLRPSKLDPYKEDIVRMVERYPFTAVQIYRKVKEEGFDGGYTIVKEYVRKIRPRKQPAFLTLHFAPGECAQVDWGSYKSIAVGNTSRRLSFFVMVLCYSRMMYVEFTVSQTMEHFLGCHQRALEFFGGVPEKVMVDNLKSAVHTRVTGQDPVFNPRYLDFANHYGFRIVPCGVRKGNEKGRVENAVGYIKKNFLAGLAPGDFKVINPAARQWLDTIANIRIHGTTKKKPVEMFSEEVQKLTPLPPLAHDTSTISQVRASKQFRVTLDTNRYSVPAEYAGMRLTMKAYSDRICLYHANKLIARHVRCYDRHQDIEDPDHPKALLARKRKARDQKLLMRFLALTPCAEQYYQGLKERRLNQLHHIRKIVGLSEIYDEQQVGRALEDACEFKAFSSEYIINLLEQRSRIIEDPGALQLTRNEDMLEITLARPDLAEYDRRCGDA